MAATTVTAVVPPADLGAVDFSTLQEGSGGSDLHGGGATGSSSTAVEWTLSHRSLQSLRCPPSSPLHLRLSHVTTLDISNNKLQSLKGIAVFVSLEVLDASYNHIRVGDNSTMLDVAKLSRLCSLDVSHNLIHRMEMEEFGVISSSRSRLHTDAMRLTLIDLSFNRLVKLPDVRLAPALEVLHVDNNFIEDLVDVENKVPLNKLRALHLAGNRVAYIHQMVPIAALGNTLQHLTVAGNPFATLPNRSKEGESSCRWWRPTLLWLAPLLLTIDHVDLSPAEGAVAARLFRDHEGLSRSLIELLNPQNRAKLAEYVQHQCPAGLLSPDAEALLQLNEDTHAGDESRSAAGSVPRASTNANTSARAREASMPSGGSMEVDAEEEGGDAEEPPRPIQVPPLLSSGRPLEQVVEQPPSFINTTWGGGPTSAHNQQFDDGRSGTADVHVVDASDGDGEEEDMGVVEGRGGGPPLQGRGRGQVDGSVSPSAKTPQRGSCGSIPMIGSAMSSVVFGSGGGIQGSSTNAHQNPVVAASNMAAVVKAMQAKLKKVSGVVETLYKADMARRHHAAIVIQKYFRSALTRMHLSQDEVEACRFIRSQLKRVFSPQHVAALAEAAYRNSQSTTPNRALPSGRHGASGAGRDVSADLQEVLVNMRSLQKVITTMWKDLEAYRLMAARERRRAAMMIQRHFRGFLARRTYREMKVDYRAFVASLAPLVIRIQRAGRGMRSRRRLGREVQPLFRIRQLECEVEQLRVAFGNRLERMEAAMRQIQAETKPPTL